MADVMQRFRPDVVFHAAAYKHVSLTEENPLEAVRNNAIGTRVTARPRPPPSGRPGSCSSRPTRRSTPRPRWAPRRRWRSGSSRRSAAGIPARCSARVRFGNVLGSSGSVVPLFRRQIEQGGPVTVTHPEMQRYFMTIPESVQLIIRAGSLASGGETYVLEMGEQVKIIDLARNMIRLSGQDPDEVPIEIVGPRPGEKLREELFHAAERPVPDRGGPDPEGRAAAARS